MPELAPLRLAQSTRGYAPFQLTHYRASWVEGADTWETPDWPVEARLTQYLYGPDKPELKSSLVLRGNFSAGAELGFHLGQVSRYARLVILADGQRVFEKDFEPGAGTGEWEKSKYKPEWKIYQAIYDRTYVVELPNACRELRLELEEGDWVTFKAVRVGRARFVPTDVDWGRRQGEFVVDDQGKLSGVGGQEGIDRETLFRETVAPWQRFSTDHSVGVHVGEWGAHQHTPHDAVLRWMHDCLANWSRAGFGWALWNLRGSFGCLDSGRKDVKYENCQGHQLDRRMLELLES